MSREYALCLLPQNVGGLGIKDTAYFSRALRLRWFGHDWNDPQRPWSGSPTPCDNILIEKA